MGVKYIITKYKKSKNIWIFYKKSKENNYWKVKNFNHFKRTPKSSVCFPLHHGSSLSSTVSYLSKISSFIL